MNEFKRGLAFAVPIGMEWAGGVLGATSPAGDPLFGYFMNRRYARVPSLDESETWTIDDIIVIGRFSGLGLSSQNWQPIGVLTHFDASKWPSASFVRRARVGSSDYLVDYDLSDLKMERVCRPIPRRQLVDLPDDGLMGSIYVQERLQKLLI